MTLIHAGKKTEFFFIDNHLKINGILLKINRDKSDLNLHI